MRRATRITIGLALSGLLGLGCAGDLERPERFAECTPGYVEQLFSANCGPDCHNAVDLEASLDLVTPGVGDRVRDAVSTTEDCSGRALIDGEGGLFLEKLTTPRCGTRMPFGVAALSASEIECVRRWVGEVHAP